MLVICATLIIADYWKAVICYQGEICLILRDLLDDKCWMLNSLFRWLKAILVILWFNFALVLNHHWSEAIYSILFVLFKAHNEDLLVISKLMVLWLQNSAMTTVQKRLEEKSLVIHIRRSWVVAVEAIHVMHHWSSSGCSLVDGSSDLWQHNC